MKGVSVVSVESGNHLFVSLPSNASDVMTCQLWNVKRDAQIFSALKNPSLSPKQFKDGLQRLYVTRMEAMVNTLALLNKHDFSDFNVRQRMLSGLTIEPEGPLPIDARNCEFCGKYYNTAADETNNAVSSYMEEHPNVDSEKLRFCCASHELETFNILVDNAKMKICMTDVVSGLLAGHGLFSGKFYIQNGDCICTLFCASDLAVGAAECSVREIKEDDILVTSTYAPERKFIYLKLDAKNPQPCYSQLLQLTSPFAEPGVDFSEFLTDTQIPRNCWQNTGTDSSYLYSHAMEDRLAIAMLHKADLLSPDTTMLPVVVDTHIGIRLLYHTPDYTKLGYRYLYTNQVAMAKPFCRLAQRLLNMGLLGFKLRTEFAQMNLASNLFHEIIEKDGQTYLTPISTLMIYDTPEKAAEATRKYLLEVAECMAEGEFEKWAHNIPKGTPQDRSPAEVSLWKHIFTAMSNKDVNVVRRFLYNVEHHDRCNIAAKQPMTTAAVRAAVAAKQPIGQKRSKSKRTREEVSDLECEEESE